MSIVAEILEDVFAPRPSSLPDGFPVAHLSPSSIDSFWKCQEQWRREKIDRSIRPTTAEQLFGSAFHRACELNFRQKIDTGEDLAAEQMRDVAGESFTEVFEEELGTNEIEWGTSKPNVVQQEVITTVVGSAGNPGYHQVLAPTVKPVAVERWVTVDTDSGVPVRMRLDVETTLGEVIDLKTTKRAKGQDEIDKSTQATSYLWGRAREGSPAEAFKLHVAIRTKQPSQQELATSRTDRQLGMFDRLVDYTVASILGNLDRYGEQGPWPAAPVLAWYCAPSQCSFWSACAWRGGGR